MHVTIRGEQIRAKVLYFSSIDVDLSTFPLALALLQTRFINTIILANIPSFLDLKILDVKVIDEYALAITDYL